MAKIIFGLSRPKEWKAFSALIMSAYSVPYSHAYIKIWSEKYQRYLIYQASSTMVNFMNQPSFLEHNVIVHEFEVEVSEEVKTRVMKFAIDNCGKPYGKKEIVGMAWVRINYWCGKDITNPYKDKNTFICSGLVSEILVEMGIVLPKHADDMTPQDVYNLLISHNFIQAIS